MTHSHPRSEQKLHYWLAAYAADSGGLPYRRSHWQCLFLPEADKGHRPLSPHRTNPGGETPWHGECLQASTLQMALPCRTTWERMSPGPAGIGCPALRCEGAP